MTTPRELLAQLERAERNAPPPPAQVRARIWSQVEAGAQAEGARALLELDDAPLLASASKHGALRVLGGLVLGGLVLGGLVLGGLAVDRRPDTDVQVGAAAEPTPP